MRLPVSSLDVSFRLPDGHDDLALLESRGHPRGESPSEYHRRTIERAVEALSRLATLTSNAVPSSQIPDHGTDRFPWFSLTLTDFEFALLGLHRFLFGDTITCLVRCACTERLEIEFSIASLLRESQPHIPRRVQTSATRSAWFNLPERRTTFRLPIVNDQLQALASSHPYAFLEQRCIESYDVDLAGIDTPHPDARTLAVIERAMESMAPTVSRPIVGLCAACGSSMNFQLSVPMLVLDELCASASGIHREIHALAATYHWQESTILALPQLRRQAYTEAILSGGAL